MSGCWVQGFTAEIIDVLQRRYPADTLVNLQTSSYRTLTDIQGAFPDDTILPSGNLKKFLTVSTPQFLSEDCATSEFNDIFRPAKCLQIHLT